MAVPTVSAPTGGVSTYRQVPSKVHRRTGLLRPVYKRRTCRDGRPYVTIPFTIPGVQATGDFGPADKLDRDYWIARVVAQVGRHDDATHPADGTPGGSDLVCTIRRVDAADDTDDQNILNDDSRLRIQANHHYDAVNDDEDGGYEDTDFNLHHLNENDQPYVRVLQVGSSRPGTGLVVSLVLVPIP